MITDGNKSSINRKKTEISSATILGILKSLKTRINKGSSAIVASIRFNLPAYLNTLFTALNPQS